jgi:glycosyltransferase involved in cell wall biosynthesis
MMISFVSPGFPPQPGGVEAVVGYLADEVRKHGHQVTIYAQRARGASFPASPDYPVRRFADWSGSRQFPVAPGLARALWRDRGVFDVIHAHSFHAVPAMMAATVPKVPLVFTPHFHAVGHTRLAAAVHTVYDPLAALLFRRADKVTCVSVAESELLLRHYPSVEPRLSVVPLGVDSVALLAAEPFETDRPIVLVAGRLEPYKRVDTAIRAFASMSNDAQLVVCGTGSHRRALERLVGELGIATKVCFRGQVSDAELRRWQRTATSTLSLSSREAFGLVLLESAVAGSRVVASDIPAHGELAHRLGSLDARVAVVTPDVAAIAATLDSQVEMGRLTTLPDQGFGLSMMARRFEAIYRSVRLIMRVIELTDLYRPTIGGLERFVALLSEELTSRGHEVHVVTSAVPGAPATETAGGVTVHRLPLLYQRLAPRLSEDSARPFHPPAPDPLFRRLLAEVVQEVKPDVIHAHAWSVFSCLPRALARPPVMVTAHDYSLACARKSLVHRSGTSCPGPSWRRCGPCASAQYGAAKGNVLAAASLSSLRLLKRVTTFTAVSGYLASRLSPIIGQVAGQSVQTLHSFVPDGLYESGWQAERPAFLPAEDGYLLYVGQLSRFKGVDVLLGAYRRLPSPPPLIMLGTLHPTSPATESLPVGVTMRTNVAHPSVIAAMVRAACVVVPSVGPDSLPMTVSEAQNCGVPVIASAVGGIPEQVLDGQTGWLVPAGDDQALADRLAALLASDDRARAMGQAGRLHGRRFTAAVGTGQFEEALDTTAQTVCRQTVSGKPRRPG